MTSGAALLVVDVTPLVETRRALEAQTRDQRAQAAALLEREADWQKSRHGLLEANRQLIEANADLRARNDALLIASEEATSATEEIETLNEEMQATNEELETLNEESQATIEELNTTNDELEARSVELQDLLISREAQQQEAAAARGALQAMVDHLPQAVAFVLADETIIAWNRAFDDLRQSIDEGSVRIDGESDAPIAFSTLLRRVGDGKPLHFSYSAVANGQKRRTYRGHLRPVKMKPAGAVVTLESE